MAEGVGFEPTRACALPVFKTGALDRSATLPGRPPLEKSLAGPHFSSTRVETSARSDSLRRQGLEPLEDSMQLEPIRTNEQGTGSVVLGRQISAEAQKVLRNTYLLLALTMVPTVAGAYLGMATASIITGSPIISFFVMLGAVIGLQFGIAHFRNSAIGIGLLLLMTGLLGWFLGPLLNYALALKNGMQLVGYAAGGTGVVLFAMGAIATTTKRDFSFMGKFLFVGMVALLVALIANMFLQIPALALTRSEEHTSELQSLRHLVCRLLLEK